MSSCRNRTQRRPCWIMVIAAVGAGSLVWTLASASPPGQTSVESGPHADERTPKTRLSPTQRTLELANLVMSRALRAAHVEARLAGSRLSADDRRSNRESTNESGGRSSSDDSGLDELPFEQSKGTLARPISGKPVTYDFGRRQQRDSVSYVRHTGLTWSVDKGTAVRAAASGEIAWTGGVRGYGRVVIVDHSDGYATLYAHLKATTVERGDVVQKGEEIGTVGEAGSLEGPKLYFELRRGEQPIDPAPWLDSSSHSPADSAGSSSGESSP